MVAEGEKFEKEAQNEKWLPDQVSNLNRNVFYVLVCV